MRTQYTVAGQSIPTITISYGTFLILWGMVISQISESTSITSYFPSLLGAPLLLSGILANAIPEKRKLWMHNAAIFGVLAALGGTRFFMVIGENGFNYASSSMLMLLVTGAIYTYICVQSFIWFRKNKEEIEALRMKEMKSQTSEDNSKSIVEENSKTIVQNITYNINDSAISGDISNTVNEKL